jgi:hypothetical protein
MLGREVPWRRLGGFLDEDFHSRLNRMVSKGKAQLQKSVPRQARVRVASENSLCVTYLLTGEERTGGDVSVSAAFDHCFSGG